MAAKNTVDHRIGVMTANEKSHVRDQVKIQRLRKNISAEKYIEWRFELIKKYREKRNIPMPINVEIK